MESVSWETGCVRLVGYFFPYFIWCNEAPPPLLYCSTPILCWAPSALSQRTHNQMDLSAIFTAISAIRLERKSIRRVHLCLGVFEKILCGDKAKQPIYLCGIFWQSLRFSRFSKRFIWMKTLLTLSQKSIYTLKVLMSGVHFQGSFFNSFFFVGKFDKCADLLLVYPLTENTSKHIFNTGKVHQG